MRLAFLTDVHGNLPALEAVLADARRAGVDAVCDGGDVVGYHPWPSECVEMLAVEASTAIMGNYDAKVLKAPQRRERWLAEKDPLKARTLIRAWEELTPDARRLLAARPDQARPRVGDLEVLVCHGSPLSWREPMGPATPSARWRELAAAAEAPLVLYGHLHLPYEHREGGTLFVTPGSAGRPEDGDPRSAWSLVECVAGRLTITRRRVEYDTATVVREVARRGLPAELGVMAARGISLRRAQRLAGARRR